MQRQEPGQDAGAWEVRRRIRIPALTQSADSSRLEQALCRIPGLHRAQIDTRRQRLVVWYDVSRLCYQQILGTLTQAGYPPPDGWWARRKQGWYRFTEANDRENAKAPPAACCNKSPK